MLISLSNTFGLAGAAGAGRVLLDQGAKRVERVEDEVRVDLRLQGAELGLLGCCGEAEPFEL